MSFARINGSRVRGVTIHDDLEGGAPVSAQGTPHVVEALVRFNCGLVS